MGMSCQMLSKTWKAHEVFLHADTNGLKSGKMKPVGWAWFTWWLIPLSKWVITGLTLLIPFITGVITYNPLTKYIRWLMSYHKVQKQLDCLTAARNPWICFSATNPPATNLDVFAAVKWGVQGAKPQWYPGLPQLSVSQAIPMWSSHGSLPLAVDDSEFIGTWLPYFGGTPCSDRPFFCQKSSRLLVDHRLPLTVAGQWGLTNYT